MRAQIFTIGAGLKTTAAAGGAAAAGNLAHLPTDSLLLLVGGCPLVVGALGGAALEHLRVRTDRSEGY